MDIKHTGIDDNEHHEKYKVICEDCGYITYSDNEDEPEDCPDCGSGFLLRGGR